MGDDQLPRGKRLCDMDLKEGSGTGQAVVWDESDAESDIRQIDQQVIAAQLDFRHQVELVLLE